MAACNCGVTSVTIRRLPRHRLQGTNSRGGLNRGWGRKSSYICCRLLLSIHLSPNLLSFLRGYENIQTCLWKRGGTLRQLWCLIERRGEKKKKKRGIKKTRGLAWALFAEGGRIKGSGFRAFQWISIQAQTGWCYRSSLISGLECFGSINVHIKAGTDAPPDRRKEKRRIKM